MRISDWSSDVCSSDLLFLELEGTTNESMFGQWRGGSFRGETTISNFYGKRFNSPEHCEPMLRTDDEGKVYAWGDWGEARLREVGYWGKVQSPVIYDRKEERRVGKEGDRQGRTGG